MKLFLFILFSISSFSATFGGKVIDSESKEEEALIGATIQIEGTKKGSISNKNGEFKINGLKNQKYTVIVSIVGYKTRSVQIDLSESDSIYEEIKLETQYLRSAEVIVSANKRVQSVQDIPISVSVLESEDIQVRAMNNLEYALQYVPGVQVTRDNVSIRGSSGFSYGVGSRVAFMLDGFPYLAGDNGDIKLDAMPLFNVEQIEIVKGAGSALYGTSAIGGVINIITEDIPEGFNSKFRAYSGYYTPLNYDEWDPGRHPRIDNGFDITLSNRFGKFSILSNIGYVAEESYRVYDEKEVLNGFLKMNYKFNDNTNITLNGNLSISENDDWAFWESSENPFFPAETVVFDNRVNSDKYSLFTGLDHIFNSNFFMSLKAGAFYTQYSNDFDEDNSEYRASDALSLSFLPQFNNKFGDNWILTYGLDLRQNIVESVVYGDQLQEIYAAYSQIEYSPIEKIDLTAGLRYDYEKTDISESNSQISPKFGVSYKPLEFLSIRASGGAGFRAPQIAEKFAEINFQGIRVLPNPDLTPERSVSYEIGSSLEGKIFDSPFFIDIALFQNNMEDMIEPDIRNGLTSDITFGNIARARIRGAELGLKTFLFDRFGLEISATALDPINLDTEQVLPFRSRYLSQNRFILPLGNYEFQLDYRYFARMETIVEELGTLGIVNDAKVRNSAHIFDARIIYDLKELTGQNLNLTLNAFNLFNYYYTQMVGNMGPTRQISLMIQGSFK